jgi:hypothetical protein
MQVACMQLRCVLFAAAAALCGYPAAAAAVTAAARQAAQKAVLCYAGNVLLTPCLDGDAAAACILLFARCLWAAASCCAVGRGLHPACSQAGAAIGVVECLGPLLGLTVQWLIYLLVLLQLRRHANPMHSDRPPCVKHSVQ